MTGGTKGLSDEECRDTIAMVGRMKVAELKDLCKSMGLKLSGKKSDLYERLEQYFHQGVSLQDTIRLLAMRTLVLKRQSGQPLPSYPDLYHAIERGDYNPTQKLRQPTSKFVHHKTDSEPYCGVSELHFRSSPFYKLNRIIYGSPQILRASKGKEVVEFKFLLNLDEISLLKSNEARTIKLYLLCGILSNNPSSEVPIEYPSPIEIQANGETILNYKGIKGKKGTAKPADLTPYIKLNQSQNKVTILYYQTEETYLAYIYLIETISCESIISNIKLKAHIHRDATIQNIKSQNEDDDIVVSNTSVTLRDPLSYTRMKFPVQSIYCKHTQCFDGLIFLQSQLQIPTWICPYCQISINIDDLAISDYFEDILSKVSEEIDLVRLNDDGTWEVVSNKEDTSKERQVSQKPIAEKSNTSMLQEEIEIISLSSDSEDEQGATDGKTDTLSKANQDGVKASNLTDDNITGRLNLNQQNDSQRPASTNSTWNGVRSNSNNSFNIDLTNHTISTDQYNFSDGANPILGTEVKVSSSSELISNLIPNNANRLDASSRGNPKISANSTSADVSSSNRRNLDSTESFHNSNKRKNNFSSTSNSRSDINYPRRQVPNIFIPSRKPRPFQQPQESNLETHSNSIHSLNSNATHMSRSIPNNVQFWDSGSTQNSNNTEGLPVALNAQSLNELHTYQNGNLYSSTSSLNLYSHGNNLDNHQSQRRNVTQEQGQQGENDYEEEDDDDIPLAKVQRQRSNEAITTPANNLLNNFSTPISNIGGISSNPNLLLEKSMRRSLAGSRTNRHQTESIYNATGNTNTSGDVLQLSNNNSTNFSLAPINLSTNTGNFVQYNSNPMNAINHSKDSTNDNLSSPSSYLNTDSHSINQSSQPVNLSEHENDFNLKSERLRAYIKSQFEAEVAAVERVYTEERIKIQEGSTNTQGYPDSMKQLLTAQDNLIQKRNLESLYRRKVSTLNQLKDKYSHMLNTNLMQLHQKSSGSTFSNSVSPQLTSSTVNVRENSQRQSWTNKSGRDRGILSLIGSNTESNSTHPQLLSGILQNETGGTNLQHEGNNNADIQLQGNIPYTVSNNNDFNYGLTQNSQNLSSKDGHNILPSPELRNSPYTVKDTHEMNGSKRQKVKGLLGIELNEEFGLKERIDSLVQNIDNMRIPMNYHPQIVPTRLDVLDTFSGESSQSNNKLMNVDEVGSASSRDDHQNNDNDQNAINIESRISQSN